MHTSRAIICTRPGQLAASVQAQRVRFLPRVTGSVPTAITMSIARNGFGGVNAGVHGASLRCWPSAKRLHTSRAIVCTRAGQLAASVQAQHVRFLQRVTGSVPRAVAMSMCRTQRIRWRQRGRARRECEVLAISRALAHQQGHHVHSSWAACSYPCKRNTFVVCRA